MPCRPMPLLVQLWICPLPLFLFLHWEGRLSDWLPRAPPLPATGAGSIWSRPCSPRGVAGGVNPSCCRKTWFINKVVANTNVMLHICCLWFQVMNATTHTKHKLLTWLHVSHPTFVQQKLVAFCLCVHEGHWREPRAKQVVRREGGPASVQRRCSQTPLEGIETRRVHRD